MFQASQEGGSAIIWNCRDKTGNIVDSGVYIAQIAKADGSREYQQLVVVK